MADKPKVVNRVIKLSETDWKWLCDWTEKLLKMISMDEITADTLRMGSILQQLKEAERDEDDKYER